MQVYVCTVLVVALHHLGHVPSYKLLIIHDIRNNIAHPLLNSEGGWGETL